MNKLFLALLAMLLVSAVFAQTCTEPDDCFEVWGSGATCVEDKCVPQTCDPEATEDECPDGFSCGDVDAETTNVCVKDAVVPECTEAEECFETWGSGATCVENKCVPQTCDPEATEDECPDGFSCGDVDAETTNVCVKDEVVPECTTDEDCEDDNVCDEGKCVEPAPECTAETQETDCEEGEVCEEGKCVTPTPAPEKITLHRIGAKFSRSLDTDAADDANYKKAQAEFLSQLNASTNCKPLIQEPVAYAKRSEGYYVREACKPGDAQAIQEKINEALNPTPAPEPETFNILKAEDPVSVELKVDEIAKDVPDSCFAATYVCGTDDCKFPCPAGAKCTKDTEAAVCGDYQKCIIADEATEGTCNSAAIYSTLVAIVLAVAATVF